MGFDPIAALRAAGKIADGGIIKEVSKEVREHLDEHAKRQETHLNNEFDRTLRGKQHKVDNVFRGIDAAENGLNTAFDIYAKISQSRNISREIKLKIEENKQEFELKKQRLDNEFKEIKHNYDIKETEVKNAHEKEMQELNNRHIEEMTIIETVRETINRLLDLLYLIARETPNGSDIPIYIGQINTALSSLKSNQYCLEEQHS